MLLIILVVRWGPCCSSFWLFGGVHAAHHFGCSVGSMLLIILVVRWGPCCSSFWLFGAVHAANLFSCLCCPIICNLRSGFRIVMSITISG
jgi:hypothetical protein